ncbi:MAG: hypothetical protein HC780_07480 [Leptolyngbyaceae cyanobacterium CSU_1_3]|nr:hypothetical protein [Leptolyngbyaceae cyanobacterium CSU_1_3]
MKSPLSLVFYGLLYSLSFSGLLVGCATTRSSEPVLQPGAMLSMLDLSTTKIGDIQKNKTNYTVRLQGKMVAQAPLLGQRAFEVRMPRAKFGLSLLRPYQRWALK